MKRTGFGVVLCALLLFPATTFPARAQEAEGIEPPREHFGFEPGTDGMLFDYEELIAYLRKLDAASPRLKLLKIGETPMGRPMFIAFISSKENIANLDRLREINKKLALDPAIPEGERAAMIDEGKVFFLATLSMHSGEVGPTQAAPLIAYALLTAKDPEILSWLDDVVYMMVPNHNPDGMDMVVRHYRKYKGTKYEGCTMPGIYHKYTGHDNNRDFVVLSQPDTRAIARISSRDWFPQVMVEKHQMGRTGPRYFVPPMHDPIAENVDAELWNWTTLFGGNMMRDMTAAGLAGVSQHYLFDDYWPGSTETCIWKGAIAMLTEMASAKYATPVYVEPNELDVRGKGLAEYKKSINMPLPWLGGWWHFGDMMKYEKASTFSILKTCALFHREILTFRNDLCRRETARGRREKPFYFVLPLEQHDQSELVRLVNLLREHGVAVYRLSEDASCGEETFRAGDFVVPLAQPFRAFAKEVLEKQDYPVRHYTPGGEIIRPYDITSWSLPLHRGVLCREVDLPSASFESGLVKIEKDLRLAAPPPESYRFAAFTAANNESYRAAFEARAQGLEVERLVEPARAGGRILPRGSFVVRAGKGLDKLLEGLDVSPVFLEEGIEAKATPLAIPRIALVETWFHDMDAGWTRFVFDTYSLPFTVVRPGDFAKTDFAGKFDVVVFPSADKSVLMEGKPKRGDEYFVPDYPPEYTKGIGKKGMKRLMTFLDAGGRIVSWERSTALFQGVLAIPRGEEGGKKGKEEEEEEEKEEFRLPVKDVSEALAKEGLYCPGSLVKILLAKDHPLAWGLPERVGVFFRGKPVFKTSIPGFDMARRVIGRFPEKGILLSGYCEKEEELANKTALVWLRKGKGEIVLFGFDPVFRASTQGVFKLLFNALLLPRRSD